MMESAPLVLLVWQQGGFVFAGRADKTVKGLLIELLLGHVRLASTVRAGHQPGGRIMSRTAAVGVSQNVGHTGPVV